MTSLRAELDPSGTAWFIAARFDELDGATLA
jgi:hypothetical protein